MPTDLASKTWQLAETLAKAAAWRRLYCSLDPAMRSGNLVFDTAVAGGQYRLRHQERMVIDTRLNPPPR